MQKKTCSLPCECWSRPCGYCRPYWKAGTTKDGERKAGYNIGKMSEVADRKMFNVDKALAKEMKAK
jgi:hypothetical protein